MESQNVSMAEEQNGQTNYYRGNRMNRNMIRTRYEGMNRISMMKNAGELGAGFQSHKNSSHT